MSSSVASPLESHAGQSSLWQRTFLHWPDKLPRRGILVTCFGEQVPFSDFWASQDLLLLQRANPDAQGTRKLLLPYAQVAAVKFTDVLKPKAFVPLGFSAAEEQGAARPAGAVSLQR